MNEFYKVGWELYLKELVEESLVPDFVKSPLYVEGDSDSAMSGVYMGQGLGF